MEKRPTPPFTQESAKQMVQLIQDDWNSQNPEKISKFYSPDTIWRARTVFLHGRENIVPFLTIKWKNELDYKIANEYWAHTDNRIAVRFEYEYRNLKGEWFRAYGNENLEFDENGLMTKRYVSINDLPIAETERKL